MKRFLTTLSTLLLFAACGKDLLPPLPTPSPEEGEGELPSEPPVVRGADYVFDDAELPRLCISITVDEWNKLLKLYDQDHHNHSYVQCTSVLLDRGEESFTSQDVGLRLRGQTSRRRPEGSSGEKHSSTNPNWHHAHFGLNCRTFTEEGDLAGVRRINLKYPKEDPSFIREHFCFDLLSRYGVWTAPKTSWCRLYLTVGEDSPAYFGIYLMSESIDRQYVKRRAEFGEEKGFLWKCAWGANLRDTDDWRFHQDDNSSNTYAYELKEDDAALFDPAKAQLKDFIKNLNKLKGAEFYNWIQQVCDVDLLLKMYAANVALGHWDDYWNDMNNFYLYFNSRDAKNYKVYMLPYDYDNTLGTSHNCGVQNDSGRQNPYRWGLEECVLLYKILEVSDFKARYTQYLKDFSTVDNPWTGQSQSASRIRGWQEFLRPYLRNDTGEDMVIKDLPASWGNHSEYRLLEDNSNNWFKVKAQSIASWIKK